MSSIGPGRLGIALAALTVVLTGVVVGSEATALPDSPGPATQPSVCAAAGPWVAPARGSVGLPPEQPLCSTGPLVVTVPGTVIDGWDVRGGIRVETTGVVVRRSRVTGDGTHTYGVATSPGASVRVEDSTVTGRFASAALGGGRLTAERVAITGVTGDGVHAGPGVRLRASTLSDFVPGGSAEGIDGVTVLAGDVVVEDCEIQVGSAGRSAVRIAPDGPPAGPVLLRSTLLGGGAYTVQQVGSTRDAVRVEDNRFARDARVAPLRVAAPTSTSGNTYVDGAPVRG